MNKSEDVGLASSLPNDDELTRKEMPRLHFLFGFDGLHQLFMQKHILFPRALGHSR
jgi:hypothetical protein